MTRFKTNTVYGRGALHKDAAAEGLKPGNANAGIVQVGDELCIFWNPYRRLYANAWIDEPREFQYSGEGTQGPMAKTSGNRVLIEAEQTDRLVTMFYKIQPTGSEWRCLGQYTVAEHSAGLSVDKSGTPRPDLRFRLVTLDDAQEVDALPKVTPGPPPPLPDEDALWNLVAKGVNRSGGSRKKGSSTTKDKRQSDPAKTAYVLRRAIDFGGVCESCLQTPGWLGDDGNPHFQAHHIEADVDLVDWIGSVCGSCHDRLHHGVDRAQRAVTLRSTVKARQTKLGRQTYELDALPEPLSS